MSRYRTLPRPSGVLVNPLDGYAKLGRNLRVAHRYARIADSGGDVAFVAGTDPSRRFASRKALIASASFTTSAPYRGQGARDSRRGGLNRRPLLAPLLVGAGAHHTPLHVNRDVVQLEARNA